MDYQEFMPVTCCFSKVALATGTTTTLTTVGTTIYAIRSKAYSKTAVTNGATPTTDAGTSAAFVPVLANNGSVFMVGFNAAGTFVVAQGNIVPLNTLGLFTQAPQFGAAPLDFCPIGYLIIKAGSSASATSGWTFGSSNTTGVTGITYTYVDVVGMPDRPQIA